MSSGRQQQQLVFFNDHSIIPETSDEDSSIVGIISESPGTSAAWLVATLIENSLQGSANHINSELSKRRIKSPTLFISFKHVGDFYKKLCKRNGVDLATIKDFQYVDLFTDLFTKHIPSGTTTAATNKHLTSMFDNVIGGIKSTPVIFVEYPEILLTTTDISPNELLVQLDRLCKLSSRTFVLLSTDRTLIDFSLTDSSDPVFKVSDFISKLYHRSNINIYCQPLATGRANDLTGTLCISRGPNVIEPRTLNVASRDYLYHINRDGNVKLYLR
ncbi:uncharacterized protein KQ657_004947 [Scheffersomyces spartinae]|uniref:Elongator complex protein 6 n=1 Tax=Scheffersomyces spartinae TaxID=45513 RepID=A0A9P7VBC8_9ASCO|nr:uncharacterized protein KQ657_004947 [Scheffersomyces spartinae]KAG7194229.1 hypothetical protein KQ657_004947 [Scheffersomyces spartinae]